MEEEEVKYCSHFDVEGSFPCNFTAIKNKKKHW